MTYVEYKQLNPFQRFAYNTKKFFCNIPHAVAHFFTALGKAIVKFFVGIGKGFANYGKTFVKGDWATKLSYLIFGVGDLSKGKYYKGILFFAVEVLYILYMAFSVGDISKCSRHSVFRLRELNISTVSYQSRYPAITQCLFCFTRC